MSSLPFSGSVLSLTPEVLREANKRVASFARGTDEVGPAPKRAKKTYSAEDRTRNGRYTVEHGPT